MKNVSKETSSRLPGKDSSNACATRSAVRDRFIGDHTRGQSSRHGHMYCFAGHAEFLLLLDADRVESSRVFYYVIATRLSPSPVGVTFVQPVRKYAIAVTGKLSPVRQ